MSDLRPEVSRRNADGTRRAPTATGVLVYRELCESEADAAAFVEAWEQEPGIECEVDDLSVRRHDVEVSKSNRPMSTTTRLLPRGARRPNVPGERRRRRPVKPLAAFQRHGLEGGGCSSSRRAAWLSDSAVSSSPRALDHLGPPLPLGLGFSGHGEAHLLRQLDVFDLDDPDFDTPGFGGDVDQSPQPFADGPRVLAAGVEIDLAQHGEKINIWLVTELRASPKIGERPACRVGLVLAVRPHAVLRQRRARASQRC